MGLIGMLGAQLGTWLVLAVSVAAVAPHAAAQERDAAAIVEAQEIAFAKTMVDRDFEAFLSFISPEAVFFAGDRPLRGRDEIGRAWAPSSRVRRRPSRGVPMWWRCWRLGTSR